MTTEKKESYSDLNRKAHSSPASAGFFDVCSLSECLYCMKSHDFMHLHFYFPDQIRRGLEPIMQLHENHSLKRAGVAGLRARANAENAVERIRCKR